MANSIPVGLNKGTSNSVPSGTEIAGDIRRYIGVPYVWGGPSILTGTAPKKGGNPTGWDCSGCVNWVLGHDFGMKLPGQLTKGFNGQMHGPPSIAYATWSKATPVSKPQAGDLCIWISSGIHHHIGIATGPTKMISALNPGMGTLETPIQGYGPLGTTLVFRRVTGVGSLLATSAINSGCLPGSALITALIARTR
jgi:cell wall-associated NlpC family hydrolase